MGFFDFSYKQTSLHEVIKTLVNLRLLLSKYKCSYLRN